MVACTSYVDDKVIEDTKEAGFDLVLLAPLSTATIVNDIFPLIEKRELRISNLKNMDMLINSHMDINMDQSPIVSINNKEINEQQYSLTPKNQRSLDEFRLNLKEMR